MQIQSIVQKEVVEKLLKNNNYFLVLQLAISHLLALVLTYYNAIEYFWLQGASSVHFSMIHALFINITFQLAGVGMNQPSVDAN